jgi:hypothetical protein
LRAVRVAPGRTAFSAHYPNDRFNAQIAIREMQENFQPALGFVQRDNVQMLRVASSFPGAHHYIEHELRRGRRSPCRTFHNRNCTSNVARVVFLRRR